MPFLEKDLKIGSILVYDDKRSKYSSRIVLQKIKSYLSNNERIIYCRIYDIDKQRDKIFASYIQTDL
jgi:hypothetical protein